MLLLLACGGGLQSRPLPPARATSDTQTISADSATDSTGDTDTGDTDTADDTEPLCPADMVALESVCMDRYEAPNEAGALPLVMYTLVESAAWCAARGRRLCYDDEWLAACAGSSGLAYPYGDVHQPGVCNDEETWRTYNQSSLSLWPASASAADIDSLDALLAAAAQGSQTAADHVEALYQAEPGGSNTGCVGEAGVYDLVGNVEEWTLRRDGGSSNFTGNLKGRYWAESRTCASNITTHADTFRFYEIGFRCCLDR